MRPLLLLLWLGHHAARAGDRPLYSAAVALIQDRYLRPESVDPDRAFVEAADAAEDAVPWLRAEPEAGGVVLRGGDGAPFAHVPGPAGELEGLPAALERLEDAVVAQGEALPGALVLPVELLRGVTRVLDRPSMIMSGERLDRFDERIRGTASGVGARVGLVGGEITIKAIFSDSPAEKGGLRTGDVILRIDGVSTVGMSVNAAVERIRGPEGSVVSLHLRRHIGQGVEELDVSLARAEIELPNVSWERDDDVGYIAIDHFSDLTEHGVLQAVADLQRQGPVRGYVLDLRGNGGGSMLQAARTADLFLDHGVIVRTAGRGGEAADGLIRVLEAGPGRDLLDEPLIVLVDGDSASASEIVAGALSTQGRALLFGDRTYGKGTVQKIFTLRGGEEPIRLKLTVAEYRLDGDRPVADVGLAPDLWTRVATFGKGGVQIPEQVGPEGARVLFVQDASEGEGAARDPTRDLAEAVVRAASGPGRAAEELALGAELARARAEEDARLVRAMATRGLDWGQGAALAAGDPMLVGPPPITVDVRLEDPASPGARSEVVAHVRSTGDAPLTRAFLRLASEEGDLPWDGVVLPIGRLEPGQEATARATVTLPLSTPRREDVVSVRLEAEGRPVQAVGTLDVVVGARSAPALRAKARLIRGADAAKVAIDLEALGPGSLTGLRVRFAWPDTPGVELLDREAGAPSVAAGGSASFELGLRLPEQLEDPLPLELVVDAEQLADPLILPLRLPLDGGVQVVAPPALSLSAPLRVGAGPMTLSVDARDDEGLEELSVWLDGQKLALLEPADRRLHLDLPLDVEVGSRTLLVRARDSDGATTTERLVLHGLAHEADPAADLGG